MAAMSFPSTRLEQSENANSTRAASSSRAVFFATSTLLYTAAIVIAPLTLNPYFAQTWDVNTFIQAAHRFLDGGNPFDLYAQSRAAQTWPYAYPPLHALVVAVALFAGNLIHLLPEYVWARVPALLADLGIAIALYAIVRRKSDDESHARAAALLWLFNPVTFYDTAVQGHFESEWLLFVLLAYAWREDARHLALPTLALAVAVLFKQTAILFTLPVWMTIAKAEGRRMRDESVTRVFHPSAFSLHPSSFSCLAFSTIIFALVIVVVCLPFLLYSNDFLYMNLTYVENVPVQTQSWIVALLGITRASPDALTSDFVLLRYQTIVTLLAAAGIAFVGARRGWSLYLAATLIAIAFFLTSKKVMGYYYAMLFPFLLVETLPRKRYDLALIALVATTWISLSPYYAAWVNHAHWWIYAALGILNSVFFVWLFVSLVSLRAERSNPPSSLEIACFGFAQHRHPSTRFARSGALLAMTGTLFVSLGLFANAVLAALLQPLASGNGSPIRAPIVAAGMEWNALAAFAALIGLSAIALLGIHRATKNVGGTLPRGAWGVVLIFAPLFFSVYTLTKESTAILEIALKAWGV